MSEREPLTILELNIDCLIEIDLGLNGLMSFENRSLKI